MDQPEDRLEHEESLRIIDSMIASARNQLTENGHLYLLWGWIVLICSIGQYLMQYVLKVNYYWAIWFLTWAALIYQVLYIRRKRKAKRVYTYADGIVKYVWIVFAILMLL